MRSLVEAGKGVSDIYEELVVKDIGDGADTLRPVYDRLGGRDGFISLEVDPRLAYDTRKTIDEAERLFKRLGRPNVMIKIPASQEGLPAIEESIYRGININITMIFSIENYVQVAESFIRGLERRAAEGKPVDGIASVASFFVSRVDTLVDSQLEQLARDAKSDEGRSEIESLSGKAAVANAKLAYQKYKEIFHGERFAAMRERGAQVQRPLWASTSTKNPKYYDLMYVDTLIGPETVNTVPPATYTAIRDHGHAELTIEKDLDESRRTVERLASVGVDLKAVTEKLQRDGLDAFVKSFDTLIDSIEAKRDALISGINERLSFSLGKYSDAIQSALKEAEKEDAVRRIWRKDAALWKQDDAHQKVIRNALGWLDVIDKMAGVADELQRFAAEIRDAGFKHVMVCGMGGSSLCPEVLARTFGRQGDFPELLVLDSTDPDTISAFASRIDVTRTLFVISSKSGTTTEPNAFYKFWFDQVKQRGDQPGKNFVAITDPGTVLETLAAERKFRATFRAPEEVGGRYS
ncbi:MAG: transaldolase, partial [Acidobacteriota bacterium]|nr:transaldolase [Acidobacteriota bacterium]